MALVTCKVCGRLFDSSKGRVCPQCLQELDDLYPKVREFIRDSRGTEFSVDSLAEGMGVDVLKIQLLVDLRYLDRDVPSISSEGDDEQRKKEQLLQQLQESIKNSRPKSDQDEASRRTRMYAQERYGSEKNR